MKVLAFPATDDPDVGICRIADKKGDEE